MSITVPRNITKIIFANSSGLHHVSMTDLSGGRSYGTFLLWDGFTEMCLCNENFRRDILAQGLSIDPDFGADLVQFTTPIQPDILYLHKYDVFKNRQVHNIPPYTNVPRLEDIAQLHMHAVSLKYSEIKSWFSEHLTLQLTEVSRYINQLWELDWIDYYNCDSLATRTGFKIY